MNVPQRTIFRAEKGGKSRKCQASHFSIKLRNCWKLRLTLHEVEGKKGCNVIDSRHKFAEEDIKLTARVMTRFNQCRVDISFDGSTINR